MFLSEGGREGGFSTFYVLTEAAAVAQLRLEKAEEGRNFTKLAGNSEEQQIIETNAKKPLL